MSLNDPIADLLNRIRTACAAGLPSVDAPHSRLKEQICRVLKQEGFVADYAVEPRGARRMLHIALKYHGSGPNRVPVIRGLRRVSSPGCRRYAAVDELRPVRSGTGIAVITTSAGLMTDREARRRRLGGEVICQVW
ncbi:MAG: 30S ribosomal protein S8 [Kiritimatiellae bacterium]|nr:30S ribosomal protein S8 [Kiritimatiellia bacterium]